MQWEDILKREKCDLENSKFMFCQLWISSFVVIYFLPLNLNSQGKNQGNAVWNSMGIILFFFSVLAEENQNFAYFSVNYVFFFSCSFPPFVTGYHMYLRKGQRTWISKTCFLMSPLNISLREWCFDYDQKPFLLHRDPEGLLPYFVVQTLEYSVMNDIKKHLHLWKWRMRAFTDAHWYQFRIKTKTQLCVVEHE